MFKQLTNLIQEAQVDLLGEKEGGSGEEEGSIDDQGYVV